MTGSLVKGAVDGLGKGLGATTDTIVQILGNPSGLMTVGVVSGVAYDQASGQYYMGLSAQNWIKLGSIS